MVFAFHNLFLVKEMTSARPGKHNDWENMAITLSTIFPRSYSSSLSFKKYESSAIMGRKKIQTSFALPLDSCFQLQPLTAFNYIKFLACSRVTGSVRLAFP